MFLRKKKLNVIVVGGGKIGEHVSKLFETRGHSVCVIEKDEELAKELSTRIGSTVINGDGTDMLVLKDAGITNADVFIALTGDDKVNLMACEIAKSFNEPKIISIVNKPGNEEIFLKLGVNDIVAVTQQVANAVENMIMKGGSRVIGEVADGSVKVVELLIGENSKYVGKMKDEVKDFLLAGIWRNGAFIFPHNHVKINAGDLILAVVRTKDLDKVMSRL